VYNTWAGLGQVSAPRGLSLHSLTLQQGLLNDYTIVAPTEWSFHPQGLSVLSSLGLKAKAPTDLCAQAASLLHAIDPCVKYQLNIIEQPG
jgi:coenzyme F420-reducing hydrogenase alpha subunit